jgi:hypothetical protein
MKKDHPFASRLVTVVIALFASSCMPPESYTDLHVVTADSGSDSTSANDAAANSDAATDTDAVPGADGAGGAPAKVTFASGSDCAADSDCGSGHCADGVCCDSACDRECYSCNEPGSAGTCIPVIDDQTASASSSCTDGKFCTFDASGSAACRLTDGRACISNEDCARGLCRTFFRDADGDGYGVTASSLSLCEPADAPPPVGYAVRTGDCCDSDGRAHPGVTGYFSTVDGCGSFDWNCDGVLERQTTTLCAGSLGSGSFAVACGASCYTTLFRSPVYLFTQQCH